MKLEYYDIYNACPIGSELRYLEDDYARHYEVIFDNHKVGVIFEEKKFQGIPRINLEKIPALIFMVLRQDKVAWYCAESGNAHLEIKNHPYIKDEFFQEMTRLGFEDFVSYIKQTYPIYK